MEGITPEIFTNYGVFGILFGGMLFYTIKKTEEREKRTLEREKEVEAQNILREEKYLKIIESYALSVRTLSQALDSNTDVIRKLSLDLEKIK